MLVEQPLLHRICQISKIKRLSSTLKEKKDKFKNISDKEALLSCKEGNYKCKKITFLVKHFTIKHEIHPFKECQEKHPSFTEVTKHIAKNYC